MPLPRSPQRDFGPVQSQSSEGWTDFTSSCSLRIRGIAKLAAALPVQIPESDVIFDLKHSLFCILCLQFY